jgi:hypothetical protein
VQNKFLQKVLAKLNYCAMIKPSITKPKGTYMILKHEFLHMVDRMGLEDGELTLAEIVWQKAERAMQGKPLQEPVLTSNKLQEFLKSYAQTHRVVSFTTEELQFLSRYMQDFLCMSESTLSDVKSYVQLLWRDCNPDDPETEVAFKELNNMRGLQRRLKKQHKTLAVIQHKLKQAKKL